MNYWKQVSDWLSECRPRQHSWKGSLLVQVTGGILVLCFPILLCGAVIIQMRHELHVAKAAYQAAEAELQRLRLEKARVEVEVEALRSDPDVIERRAREELNMVRPDELVFSFPDQTQKEKSKDGSQTNSTNTR